MRIGENLALAVLDSALAVYSQLAADLHPAVGPSGIKWGLTVAQQIISAEYRPHPDPTSIAKCLHHRPQHAYACI